jgi:hypothetical protein
MSKKNEAPKSALATALEQAVISHATNPANAILAGFIPTKYAQGYFTPEATALFVAVTNGLQTAQSSARDAAKWLHGKDVTAEMLMPTATDYDSDLYRAIGSQCVNGLFESLRPFWGKVSKEYPETSGLPPLIEAANKGVAESIALVVKALKELEPETEGDSSPLPEHPEVLLRVKMNEFASFIQNLKGLPSIQTEQADKTIKAFDSQPKLVQEFAQFQQDTLGLFVYRAPRTDAARKKLK